MKYRIELLSFRAQTNGEIKWSALVVDEKGLRIPVDDNWSLGSTFADSKEEALLELRKKLAKHETEKREIEDLNIKMGEIVEVEV